MTSAQTMADAVAIRQLCEAFGDAVVRRDGQAWAGTWAQDATWVTGPGAEITGRDNILAAWSKAMEAVEFCSFIGFPGPVGVDGDRAFGRFHRQETLFFKSGDKRQLIGFYTDEYVRLDGNWYIQRRENHVLRDETIKASHSAD